MIEIAAGWSIILIATGVYLWWPRGQGGVLRVRGTPAQRMFWRDLHAVVGIMSGAVVLFLALTGMPWSMFWGDHVQRWATEARLNEPAAPAPVMPEWMLAMTMPGMPHQPHAQDRRPDLHQEMPWTMQKMAMPASSMAGMAPITVEQAMARFRALGVAPGAAISLPDGPDGAWMASWRPDRVEDTRVVYLDQYSARLLGDTGWKDWGPVGKAIEWGGAVHMGLEYGAINRVLMLAGCIALELLVISALTMWWKRRPRGALGVPPLPADPRAARGVLLIIGLGGALFPLVGASMLVALGAGWMAERVRAA